MKFYDIERSSLHIFGTRLKFEKKKNRFRRHSIGGHYCFRPAGTSHVIVRRFRNRSGGEKKKIATKTKYDYSRRLPGLSFRYDGLVTK